MKKLTTAQEKALEVIRTKKVTWREGMRGVFPESYQVEQGDNLNQRTVNCLIDKGLCRIDWDKRTRFDAPVIYTGEETAPEASAPEASPETVPEEAKENRMKNIKSTIINQADNNDPAVNDLFCQTATIKTGENIPEGWRVLDGNNDESLIARVVMRHEVDDGAEA